MKYKLAKRARADLLEISRCTNAAWGSKQAETYIDSLRERFRWLTKNRPLGCKRDDIRAGLYSYREHSHIILFREYSEGIEILRVLHRRMDIERHL